MSLLLDASTPALASATGSDSPTKLSVTTASFSPPKNALLVAMVAVNTIASGQDASQTMTSTGGLSWTLRVRKNKNAGSTGGAGSDSGSEIWTAPTAAAPGSITVTSTFVNALGTSSDTTFELKLFVEVLTDSLSGVPLVGNIAAASSTSGLPSVADTVVGNSYVLAAVSDWSANAGAATYGTGQTQLASGADSQFAWHFFRTTSTIAPGTTSQTMNMTAPSAQNYDLCVLEVQMPALPFQRRIPSQAVHRPALW